MSGSNILDLPDVSTAAQFRTCLHEGVNKISTPLVSIQHEYSIDRIEKSFICYQGKEVFQIHHEKRLINNSKKILTLVT